MRTKQLIKQALPKPLLYRIKREMTLLSSREPRAAFRDAGEAPEYLDDDAFEALAARFPMVQVVGYGPEETALRGREKAQDLMKLMRSADQPVASLEIGCWDGMTLAELARNGWRTHGIDIRDEAFDGRAERAGAVLKQMDASKLDFADDTFDLVFSYDGFEHFADPAAVLSEALRVTRDGGLIVTEFGPLYNASFGMHAFPSVCVPYCQFLFRPEQICAFTNRHGLDAIDFQQCNRWSAAQFRALWARNRDRLIPQSYFEIYDCARGALPLIAKYPTCFRSKVDDFDELLVNSISAIFKVQKTPGEQRHYLGLQPRRVRTGI